MLAPLTPDEADRVGLIFEEYGGLIESVARRHTRSAQDVPDVVQHVGLQVCRNLAGFQGRSGITTWLYRVTVNASIDTWRDGQRIERVREALARERPGLAYRSIAPTHANPSIDDEGRSETYVARRPVPANPWATTAQLAQLLEAERAGALRDGLAEVRPEDARRLRDDMTDATVQRDSRQARHRSRLRLRAVLSADPRIV